MDLLTVANAVIGAVFFVCYGYQLFYILVPFFTKPEEHRPAKENTFAVLISARNEEAVIGNLLRSLQSQDYDKTKYTVFVLADNCTDRTAEIARAGGAVVYERQDAEHVGKGYALDALLEHMRKDDPAGFDAYLILDADNVLSPDYLTQMNRSLSDGYEVVTGYRNSKNYGTNWISAGYALWFIRESSFLNRSRMRLGVSCTISGTGFAFSRKVLADLNGRWPFHMLTEDLEFSAWLVANGYRAAYCEDAVLFDEQPITFAQSWKQRMRWGRGFLQVALHYYRDLLRALVTRHAFAAYDVIMTLMPAYGLSLAAMIVNGAALVISLTNGTVLGVLHSIWQLFVGIYLMTFLIGLITLVSDWKKIYCPAGRKILLLFTLPIYMLTYIPIAVAALFVRVKWEPIHHTEAKSLEDIVQHPNS